MSYRRFKRCQCMNNNYYNCNSCCPIKDNLETVCNNINYCCNSNNENKCNCGFDDEEQSVFPENPMLAQSYVPIQQMDQTFKPCIGLKHGTIFPELVSPYSPGDSMKQMELIESLNTPKEGCNS